MPLNRLPKSFSPPCTTSQIKLRKSNLQDTFLASVFQNLADAWASSSQGLFLRFRTQWHIRPPLRTMHTVTKYIPVMMLFKRDQPLAGLPSAAPPEPRTVCWGVKRGRDSGAGARGCPAEGCLTRGFSPATQPHAGEVHTQTTDEQGTFSASSSCPQRPGWVTGSGVLMALSTPRSVAETR